MSAYAREDEERIRAQAQVRAWGQAKLLSGAQTERLEAELCVDLRRTNPLLRAGLALFTGIVVIASVLLVGVVLEVRGEIGVAATAAVGAAVCLAAAEYFAGALRLYRHGVEEALATSAVLLLGVAATATMHILGVRWSNDHVLAVGLTVCAIGGLWLYARFGFVYAAAGAMACIAMIPFQLIASKPLQHLAAAALMAAAFGLARSSHLAHGDDYPGDDCASLQAAAWAAMYLALNLRVWDLVQPFVASTVRVHDWFYWLSYLAILAIPAVGLRLGIRQRDRELIDVNITLALVTLVTNKPYLGWPRREWDPMILGVLLMAGAIALRRWLARGPDGERGGFTPAQVLSTDAHALSMIATASAAFHPHAASPVPAPGSDFRGGRSGGGGGGAGF
jgi:hypothetical protein